MQTISCSVVKKDHAPKMEGRSIYVCDVDKHGILCGKLLRSKYARAKLLSVKVPELPDGYYYVDRNDVPGDNNVNIVMDDTPVYARETVEYIGEPIGMVCGPDEAVCEDILSRIEVQYEELEPMLDLRKADEVFFNYEYEKGDPDKAFAKADSVLIEFVTGAKLKLLSVRGERIVDVEKFYLGRKKLDLANDEIIAEILLPKAGIGDYYYKKVGGRNALAISRVSFAGILSVENGVVTRFSAGFGAVADTVLRYRDLEALLIGKTLDEAKALRPELLKAYSDRMVLTRGRVSAEYRKTVCMNLLADFLTEKGISV